ncbi:hypothetical protein FOBRF1_014363 [Fusarium oxysporum]
MGIQDKVSVILKMNSLDVVALVFCVLPHKFTFPVDSDLAVFLHPEFVAAAIAGEAVAWVQPVVVVESAHFEGC